MTAPAGAGGVSRRAMLKTTAAVAGAAASGLSAAQAQTGSTEFGAPLVELYVPAGALTPEQKGAMIRGFTDVLVNAVRLQPEQTRRLFVEIIETAEGGFGVGGEVFVPRRKA